MLVFYSEKKNTNLESKIKVKSKILGETTALWSYKTTPYMRRCPLLLTSSDFPVKAPTIVFPKATEATKWERIVFYLFTFFASVRKYEKLQC